MNEIINKIKEIDDELRAALLAMDAESAPGIIKGALLRAAEQGGRGAKLRMVYVMERMAEIARDLRDDGVEDFHERYVDIIDWIDTGLDHAAKLVNADSKGKWIANFDQTIVRAKVRNPKDPKEVAARRERAKATRDKFAAMRANMNEGSIIVPGSE